MEGGGSSKVGSPEDAAARRAREYHECSFCNRGFTNAQALGGHMNVHRDERRRQAAAPPADGGGSQKKGPGSNEELDLELRL
ncbi:hypothetical protein ACQJBY_062868 [Aegilops geniculata]